MNLTTSNDKRTPTDTRSEKNLRNHYFTEKLSNVSFCFISGNANLKFFTFSYKKACFY